MLVIIPRLLASSLGYGQAPFATGEKGFGFTHLDVETNKPTMVDVNQKTATFRTAKARPIVRVPANVMSALLNGYALVLPFPSFATCGVHLYKWVPWLGWFADYLTAHS